MISYKRDQSQAYLQTLCGTNKDFNPAKAIAAHVRGFVQFIPPTNPQMALVDLKNHLRLSPTTVADKLRAICHAIKYVQYQHSNEAGNSHTYTKCQEVKERLNIWEKGLTKEIRKQQHHNFLKSHNEV